MNVYLLFLKFGQHREDCIEIPAKMMEAGHHHCTHPSFTDSRQHFLNAGPLHGRQLPAGISGNPGNDKAILPGRMFHGLHIQISQLCLLKIFGTGVEPDFLLYWRSGCSEINCHLHIFVHLWQLLYGIK